MTARAKMVTLLPATDVDLGRWLMELWQRPYDESPHAPIFHILALKNHGVSKEGFPLLIENDQKYAGIDAMVEAFDALSDESLRLVPDQQKEPKLHRDVMELQHHVRHVVGIGTVLWAYTHFMAKKSLVWKSFTTGVPWFEKLFLTFGFSVVRTIMVKKLKLGDEAAVKGLQAVEAGFDLAEDRLSDGRKFLCGDRLTLADLAFATSCGPMVLARGYGGYLPQVQQLDPAVREVVLRLRDRPAGQFIQRLYDEHRAG